MTTNNNKGIKNAIKDLKESIDKAGYPPSPLTMEENDDPEITEKDFEDMYISQGKNDTEKMERRFNVWLGNRDDDFSLDIWDFRCLQDFIKSEISSAVTQALEEQRGETLEEIDIMLAEEPSNYPTPQGQEAVYGVLERLKERLLSNNK